jgi:hypothetical protein
MGYLGLTFRKPKSEKSSMMHDSPKVNLLTKIPLEECVNFRAKKASRASLRKVLIIS